MPYKLEKKKQIAKIEEKSNSRAKLGLPRYRQPMVASFLLIFCYLYTLVDYSDHGSNSCTYDISADDFTRLTT